MPIIQIYLEEEKDLEGLKDELKNIEGFQEIQESRDKAPGVEVILLGIKVAAAILPVIVTIVKKLMKKKAIVKFNCPNSGKKHKISILQLKNQYKITIEGLKDENKISQIIEEYIKLMCKE